MEKLERVVFELGAYTDIIEINFPRTVKAGEDVSFYFVAHLRATPPADWSNLAYGIQYVDGQQDKITVDSLELSKGNVAAGSSTIPSVCTTTKVSGKIKALATTGDYTFKLAVGHAESGTFYADTSITVYLTVTQPTPTGTETMTMLMEQLFPTIMQIMMLVMVMSMMAGMMRSFKLTK